MDRDHTFEEWVSVDTYPGWKRKRDGVEIQTVHAHINSTARTIDDAVECSQIAFFSMLERAGFDPGLPTRPVVRS